MKTILKNVWIAGVLAASPLSQPVFGQVLAATPGSQPQAHPGLLLRASNDILNAKIFSSQGDEIGHIRDVLLNPKTGQLSHVVVGIGGWQGIGEELAIVPRQLVTQDEQHADTYILAADTEKFKSAPVFKQDQWATVVQPDYLAKIDRYYAGGPQVRQSSNASQPQQMTAKAPPAATAPKPPEEQPRKKLQIEPRPRFFAKDKTSGEKAGHQEGKTTEKEKTDKIESASSELSALAARALGDEGKDKKTAGTQSESSKTRARTSAKSHGSSDEPQADSPRSSRKANSAKHRKNSCQASRSSMVSSRSSEKGNVCKCGKAGT